MEGNFFTKPQRQKFVNEIKKTHFKLGNYRPEPQGSKSVVLDRAVSASALATIMRATNFDLGTDKPVKASESTSRFLPLEVPKCPYVIPDVSIDLRKTHYSLGSYKEPSLSTARSAQSKTSTKIPQAEIIMTADFCQAHHFVYGTDKPKLFSQSPQPVQNSKAEAQALKKQLQMTHFVIGSENPSYETTTHKDFTGVKTQYEKSAFNLQKEHFKLGTDKTCYDSMYKTSQESFKQGKQEFKGEVLKDLRQTHFVLGNSKQEYLKTSQDFAGGRSDNEEKFKDGLLRKTNFTFGNFYKPQKSTYKDSHSTSESSTTVSARDKNDDKMAHFTMGSSNGTAESVHKADFQKFPLPPAVDNKWGEYLRSNHFDFGKEKANFESQNRKYGKEPMMKKNENSDLKNDLRASHFLLGNDKRDMATTSQKDFKGMIVSKSVQNLGKAHGKHSHRDGNGKFVGRTEQQSRFNWIKPVADNKFKFSLE